MHHRDARLEALVAPGNFVSVRPKCGSGGHWVGTGSGTLPCCSLSPLLLLGLAAPSGCSLTSLPSTCTSSLLGAPSSRLFPLGASNRMETPLEAAARRAGGVRTGLILPHIPGCATPAPSTWGIPLLSWQLEELSWEEGWE